MENFLPTRFHALGDPTRLAVIERLVGGPLSVSELAEPHAMVLSAFTKHLRVLEEAGLIDSEKVGRVRTCRLNPAALADIDRWFADRRRLWATRLDQLEYHLNQTAEEPSDEHSS